MAVEPMAEQPEPKVEPVKSADLVLGVVADIDRESLITLCDSLRTLPGSPIVAALRNDLAGGPAAALEASEKVPSPYFIPWPSSKTDDPGIPVVNIATAYQSAFAVSEQLNARACCIVASTIENAKPDWIRELVQPLLEEDFDLVAPQYALRKFEGLLNSSIISPLTRCLYGKRIRNPMGPDLGISRRLFTKMLASEKSAGSGNGVHPLAAIAPAALCDNLKICQVHVGPRTYPPPDWTNISSLVAQVLSPIFLDMEKRAACWQRTRSSVPLASFGQPVLLPQDTGTVDISRMVESFKLGIRDLQEIWDLVLPPSSLLELRKLARLPLEQFRMPDELWVRIVYDFALAHRLRTINRDHLLKSMTPLYLAWVAAFARDSEAADAGGVERILERLAVAYESAKPYLVSRWRWPDRFNP